MRRALLIAGILGCAALVTGCSESPQVTVYKEGKYQGKPDKQAWDNDQFKGDKVAWDKAISARSQKQNEYTRIAN